MTTVVLLLLAVLLPIGGALASVLAGDARARRWRHALPLASVPAVMLAVLPPAGFELGWLLLGTRLGIDGLARAVLLLVGLAWTAAATWAAGNPGERWHRFALFWQLSLSGIVLAVLAQDLAGFYFGYALMTLAAYGLVVHAGTDEARRAGRVYLVMAILAEGCVLAGVLMLAHLAGSAALADLPMALVADPELARLAAWLLVLGFSVKVGVVGLHLWLPLAHPVAPVPASAVLSGVIVKAGVLGLVKLVPVGVFDAGWLQLWVGLGLATAFYGVAVGLFQTRLKTILAYSTVSQMGLLFIAAMLLVHGAERGVAVAGLGLLVLHHGLNKAALFLAAGGGRLAGWWRWTLFALPALALVGLPLTSGMLAKSGLKSGLAQAGADGAVIWLSLGSIATACLLWRAARVAASQETGVQPVHPAWPALVLAGLAVPWLWARVHALGGWPSWGGWLDGTWPVLAAIGLVVALRWLLQRHPGWDPGGRVPEGDLVVPLERLLKGLRTTAQRLQPRWPRWTGPAVAPRLESWIRVGERSLGTVSAAGLSLLVLGGLVWLAWS